MTQTSQTTDLAALDELFDALLAQVEVENAEVRDLPITGPVTAFPSPFAD